MFWGTDITKMPCSWHQCVTMFTEELPWLKAATSNWSWARRSAPGGLEPGSLTADYALLIRPTGHHRASATSI